MCERAKETKHTQKFMSPNLNNCASMITDLRQPGFIHEQKQPAISPQDYDGELRVIEDVTKSMSRLGNSTPMEEDEPWGSQHDKSEPESTRGAYHVLENKPCGTCMFGSLLTVQEVVAESKRGTGQKVKPTDVIQLKCPVCKGEHSYLDCPKNEYNTYDEIMEARRKLTLQNSVKGRGSGDASSTQVLRNKKKKSSKVAGCKAKSKKAGRVMPEPSSSSQGARVEIYPCRICEKYDHQTWNCPYRISIQPGERIGSEAVILCRCCHKVDAHDPREDDQERYYYAVVKHCGYCNLMGKHQVNSYEDCPDVQGKESLRKIIDETLKNWGKIPAAT